MIALWKAEFKPAGVEIQPLDVPLQVKTLDQLAAHLPQGAYTTLRTYRVRYVLPLDDHVRRLEQTAALADRPLRLDARLLRDALRQVTMHYPSPQSLAGAQGARPGSTPTTRDLRIRLTLDLEIQPGDLYIALQPLDTPPVSAYQEGVRAITCDLQRILPQAKLTRFIARAEPVRQALPEDTNEAIMVDPGGRLLEGLSSNFFALSGGALFTAGEGVLAGVTRSLALEAAARLGLPVHLQPVHLDDIPTLQGAFITSASRGLLPVRQIDEHVLGDGRPAPLVHQLHQAFEACIQEKLEIL